jgi:hypothetical protein
VAVGVLPELEALETRQMSRHHKGQTAVIVLVMLRQITDQAAAVALLP